MAGIPPAITRGKPDMKIRVEPGKTYLTRDGDRVTIAHQTPSHGQWEYIGNDSRGRVTWRSAKGQHGRYRSGLDLVKEVTDTNN
jgi:hypothetical protein